MGKKKGGGRNRQQRRGGATDATALLFRSAYDGVQVAATGSGSGAAAGREGGADRAHASASAAAAAGGADGAGRSASAAAAAGGADDAGRGNRKALPSWRVEVDAEVRVLKAMAASCGKFASVGVSSITDPVGEDFDYGGCGGDGMLLSVGDCRFGAEPDEDGDTSDDDDEDEVFAERRAVVQAWARQGWPKRVLYALGYLGVRAHDEDVFVREYLESEVHTSVFDYTQDVAGPSGIVKDDAAACMVFEKGAGEEEGFWTVRNLAKQVEVPGDEAERGTVNTRPKEAGPRYKWQDDEFIRYTYQRKHRQWMNRILVVATGDCSIAKAASAAAADAKPCPKEGCEPRCQAGARMVWNGLGHLSSWGGDQDLDVPDEVPATWNCEALFQQFPAMRPRPGRALIRVNNSRIANNGDQCSTLFNVPLPDAPEDDWDIAAVVLAVATD